tara:strand:- start:85854 stop:86018 length:165 start_codon:yes stop_codon:yes gene_type:complete
MEKFKLISISPQTKVKNNSLVKIFDEKNGKYSFVYDNKWYGYYSKNLFTDPYPN